MRERVATPLEERPSRLSAEDRALSERLDWGRIHAAATDLAVFYTLPAGPRLAAPLPTTGCTCRLEQCGPNDWRVASAPCAYCREWDRKLTELGVTGEKAPAPEQRSGQRKWRRAA